MNEHEQFITPKKAREILQITNKTLRIWDKENKIRTFRTPSGVRRYNLQDIKGIINGGPSIVKIKKVCYCRVSSKKQMDDLERQKDFFRSRYPDHELVTDIGSGINWKRKGLQTILDRAMRRDIQELVVAHRDRLCRFAFELLEWIFEHNDVQLVVLDQTKDQSSTTELTELTDDIVHVYSCREMGKRRYSNKKNTSVSNDETEKNDNTVDGNQEICI